MVTCNASASEPCFPSPGNLTNPTELFRYANTVTGDGVTASYWAGNLMFIVLWVSIFASFLWYEKTQDAVKALMASSIIMFVLGVFLNYSGIISGWMVTLTTVASFGSILLDYFEGKK